MNRKSIMIALLTVLLLLPVLGQAAPVGKFTSIEGNVDITSPGGDAVPAKPGDEVNAGDTIRAKSGAKCEVAFLDGSIIRVAANSRVRVAEFSGRQKKGQHSVVLDLSRGKIQSIVKPVIDAASSGGSIISSYSSEIQDMVNTATRIGGYVYYEVRTPTVVYRARGTSFFTYYQSGISGSLVTEGRVEAFSLHRPGEVHQISAGQSLVVADSHAEPQIRTATAMERQQHERDTARSEGPREATAVAAGPPSPVEALMQPVFLDQVKGLELPQAQQVIEPPSPPVPPIVLPTAADTTPPIITLEGLPAAITNAPSAAITVTASEAATFTYTLDGAAVASPNLANLMEGSHTFIVTAMDGAGNKSSRSHTWTTDYTPAGITLTGTPPAATNVSTATIGVASSETATFTYTLDGVVVTSPKLTNLSEGNHTFTVTAADQAGNSSAQTFNWTTDYTPPEVAIAPQTSVGADGTTDVTIDLTGNEEAAFTSRLDEGEPITGAVLDLTGLDPGDHTLTIEATDNAGNKGAHTLTFNLENYGLTGLIAGAVDGALAGDVAAVAGKDWGGWHVDMSGSAAVLPGANWQARAGGQLAGTEHRGYWLADLGGETWTGGDVNGAINYRYLTTRALGYFGSPLAGTYQFNPGTSLYDWQATAGGVFAETPLAFSAEIDGGYHQYENNIVNYYRAISGFLGTTVSPFATARSLGVPGDAVDLYLMGEAMPEGKTAWWGSLYETRAASGDILPDGFIAGRTSAGNAAEETLTGSLVSLYIDEAGNAGTLEGYFDGLHYPGIGMFEATSGSLWATKKATGYTAYDPAVNLGFNYLDGTFSGSFFDGLNQPAGGIAAGGSIADVSWGKTGSYAAWLQKSADNPEPWGIFNLELGGHYTGTPTDNFTLQVAGASPWRGGDGPGYWLAGVYGTQWSEGQIAGSLLGSYLTDRVMGTMQGDMLGSYDTFAPGSWEAVSLGTFEEQPLLFSAEIDAGYHQFENSLVAPLNKFSGLLGTTASPFASATSLGVPGDAVDLYMMGHAWPEGRTSWWGSLYETRAASGDILPDGFIAGRTSAGNTAEETLTGSLVSLYIDEAGNAGTLEGFFDGFSYPMIGGSGGDLFEATSGALWATKKASGYGSYDPAVNLGFNYLDGAFSGSFLDGLNQPTGAISGGGSIADISWGKTGSYTTWLQQSAAAPEPWGIYNMELGGQYTGTPADTWTMQLGGSSWRGLGSREYWQAGIYGMQWSERQLAGYLEGLYLTDRVLGNIQGEVLGSYDTFTAGAWEAAAIGTFEEEPLVLGGEVNASYHYYDGIAGEITSNYGYLNGLFGTVEDMLAPGAELHLLGEAAPYGQTTWWGDLSNIYAPDGGVLPVGLIGGRTTAYYDYAAGRYLGNEESHEGTFLGLYVDKDGKAGTLEGDFTGAFYPMADGLGDNNAGLFIANGFLQATPKASGFDPATAAYNYSFIEGAYAGALTDNAGNNIGSVTAAAAGSLQDTSWGYLGSYSYWLEKAGVPEPWGIFNMELGGDYQLAEGATAPQTWALTLGGTSFRGLEANEYWIAETTDGTWAETAGDKRIAAGLTGRYLTPTTLGQLNGGVLGSYDTSKTPGNWEAIALGTFEDTQPLAFSAELFAAYHQNENNLITSFNSFSGLLGTTASPFASATELNMPGAPVDLYMMGEALPEGKTVWWGSLYDVNGGNGALLPDGFIAGRSSANNAAEETLTGSLVSLYIDPAGSAGIIEGDFDGFYYPLSYPTASGSGIFEATAGSLWATKKAAGYASYDPAVNLGVNYLDGDFSGSFLDGLNQPTGAIAADGRIADVSWGNLGSYTAWLQQDAAAPEPWGIFNIELGGHYTGVPANNFALQLGGMSWRTLDSREYWLAEVYGTVWPDREEEGASQQILGSMQGSYLTTQTMGTMTGTMLGSAEPDILNPNAWQAVTMGTFEEQPLAFVSDLASDDGAVFALMGGTESLWTNTDTPALMMGDWGGMSGVWTMPVWSDNFQDGSVTTYDGGAYRGFSSLVVDDGQGTDASLIGLYVDPAGQTGYLQGELPGISYPDLGLFSAQGDLARTEIEPAPAGMTAANFDVTTSGPQDLTLTGAAAAVGFTSETRDEAWITGLTSWGIWQSVLEGDGALAAPVSWQWETAGGINAADPSSAYWTNYDDVTWANDPSKIAGTVSGAKADWINASTSVFGGAIKGLFDPATASWKAVSQGAWMETGKFLEMTTSNPAALQAMNIPAIQVGSATLAQGAGTVNNLSNVTMDNVRFFATSTGSVPKIWATNAVSGNFSAAPVVGGAAVPLAGGGLNANFGINNWGNGTWGAKVTGGTGTLSGGSYNGPVNFQGGAAGQIGAGSFTGTGAGVVK